MKDKKTIIATVVISLIVVVVGFLFMKYYNGPSSKIRGKGTLRLEKSDDIVLQIQKNMTCIPVTLYLYHDGIYELLTDYDACRPFKKCTQQLHYTKSIKGKYNYNLTKILDESIDYDDIEIDYEQVDYKIVSGNVFGEKYDHNYIIKKGQKNKQLEEFLKEIDVDLNICAIPNYN